MRLTGHARRDAIRGPVGAAALLALLCFGRSVRADDPPGFEGVPVTIDPAAKTATGTLFGVIKRRATLQEGYGCVLEP